MFMGYLGRTELTQEVFTSDGFLRSGDVVYISKVKERRGKEGEREEERERNNNLNICTHTHSHPHTYTG